MGVKTTTQDEYDVIMEIYHIRKYVQSTVLPVGSSSMSGQVKSTGDPPHPLLG
jgi:hypothetical protein